MAGPGSSSSTGFRLRGAGERFPVAGDGHGESLIDFEGRRDIPLDETGKRCEDFQQVTRVVGLDDVEQRLVRAPETHEVCHEGWMSGTLGLFSDYAPHVS